MSRIHLTESQLRNVIQESVKRILNEGDVYTNWYFDIIYETFELKNKRFVPIGKSAAKKEYPGNTLQEAVEDFEKELLEEFKYIKLGSKQLDEKNGSKLEYNTFPKTANDIKPEIENYYRIRVYIHPKDYDDKLF